MYFFTATIVKWQKLLAPDKYKSIITDSFRDMAHQKRCYVYGFVVMPNHFHLLWYPRDGYTNDGNEAALLRFIAHQFKKDLKKYHSAVLERFRSTQSDRAYHFWQRRAYASELYNREVVEQKLDYIHNNPLQEKWILAEVPEQYHFSSAAFYLTGKDDFGFITHYAEHI